MTTNVILPSTTQGERELDLYLYDMANEQSSSHKIEKILKKNRTRKAIRERIKGLEIIILSFGLMAITPADIDASALLLMTIVGAGKLIFGK